MSKKLDEELAEAILPKGDEGDAPGVEKAARRVPSPRRPRSLGLLLTLKLLDWKLAEEIPSYLGRIRSWGYRRVQARQLAHNRQEICVAASK